MLMSRYGIGCRSGTPIGSLHVALQIGDERQRFSGGAILPRLGLLASPVP